MSSYGKFKDAESLLKAYQSLEKEFTQRSQKLKYLEQEQIAEMKEHQEAMKIADMKIKKLEYENTQLQNVILVSTVEVEGGIKEMNKVEKYLIGKNIKPSLKGFKMIEHAINMASQDEKHMAGVTTTIYPHVAQIFDTTPERVARAIKTAISVANIHKTNKEFIATAVLELKDLGD